MDFLRKRSGMIERPLHIFAVLCLAVAATVTAAETGSGGSVDYISAAVNATEPASVKPVFTPTPMPARAPQSALAESPAFPVTQLQRRYMTYLQSEGLTGEIDADGDIFFKKDGYNYYIIIDEDDPEFFRLVMPGIWTVKSVEERVRALNAMENATQTTKVAKVHFVGDRIWVSVELFLAQPDAFKPVFQRCINVLGLARNEVLQAMKNSAE